jgi:hypothetical protein
MLAIMSSEVAAFRWLRAPWVFGLAVAAIYALLALPILAHHGFDSSVFIVAGDRYVTATQTPAPIIVRPHSDGYDGQFYYRLAVAPLSPRMQAYGVTLVHPAWRMQRILLPLTAYLLSAGQPQWVSTVLFAVNLTGLFAIGWLAMHIARAKRFPLAVPLCIAAWPGLLIALTHDTTEILAAALLLSAVTAWFARRPALSAAMVALASLTRETAILVAAGILVTQLWRLARPASAQRDWRGVGNAAASLVPFLLWWHFVVTLWQETPQAHGIAHNAGWPLQGWAQAILASVLGEPVGFAPRPRDLTMRATMLTGIGAITVFCVAATGAAWRVLQDRADAALAAGWLLVLALMSVLTANGPFIDSTAYFRAFTECWVLGWILLGAASIRLPRPAWMWAVALPLIARNWELCWIQLN